MRKINLPCLRGNFGEWTYFSTVMKVKDIVENSRIITVPESKTLYTKNINQVLQREIDNSRISKIKNYLLDNSERFFSSLIVAIHKGDPHWADFDLERQFRVENDIIADDDVEFIENKLGVLTLSGNEEIFVLDGQHRLLGLRAALKDNILIGEDEVSIVIVIHKDNLKSRTRRLFTVLNRYAVAIKPAEKIILDEDDAAAILTRKLVQEHSIFKLDKAVSSTKQFSLSFGDRDFTSLVCLYEVSKVLIDFKYIYKNKSITRPPDEILKKLYLNITDFWDFFFKYFPQVVRFIKAEEVSADFIRNKESGGSLLLRPEGQLLIANVYKDFQNINRLNEFKENVAKIDYKLSGNTWKYVFWRGDKMETKHKKLKKALFNYLLNNYKDHTYINDELKKVYEEYNVEYKGHIKPVTT